LKAKGKLVHNENVQKMRCNANKSIAELTANHRQNTGDSGKACE